MSDDKVKTNEVDELVPDQIFIKTVGGETVKVPPLTWGKEIQVFKSLGKMIGEMPKMKLDPSDPSKVIGGLELTELIPKLVKVLPEELTILMEVLLEKEKQWVLDNLSAKEVLNFIVPFLQNELKELGSVLKPVFDEFQGKDKKKGR